MKHSTLSLSSSCLLPFYSVSNLNFQASVSFFSQSISFFIFCPCHPCIFFVELVRIGEPASKTVSEVNRALLAHFLKAIITNYFRAQFNIGRLYVKQILIWALSSNTVPSMEIADVMRVMVSKSLRPLSLKII